MEQVKTERKSGVLAGKRIIFLGSSVTFGAAAGGESFVEWLERLDGIIAVKEAVSGTTLVDEPSGGCESYIARMKKIGKDIVADAFICQLSTNDASQKKALGAISESFLKEDFDTLTVAGAMEYVIAYARETWNCPVIFYTGTRYDSREYAAMVELLWELAKKWEIGVIDLWNDERMNAVSAEDYSRYMADPVHPAKEGYLEWWTPVFEAYLCGLWR